MIKGKIYNLVFISTFINQRNISNLIKSVVESNNQVKILFLIINQTLFKVLLPDNQYIDWHEVNSERLSLSRARNLGINYLLENNISFKYIMFPDDDTTFDKDFFSNFTEVIDNKQENYLIDVFGENTKDLYFNNTKNDGDQIKTDKPKMIMSVNMLINYNTFCKVGLFDEKMGLGAEYGAGEDTDYFLRCVALSGSFIYTKKLWNYHPKYEDKHKALSLQQLAKKYSNYGRGVIFLYVKHRMYFSAFELCLSALGGALVAMLNLDFKLFIARLYAFFIRLITFIRLSMARKFIFIDV